MIEIGLLRHFPTRWNAEGRLQGRADIPLSEEGRAALARRRLPERWRGLPVIASPLSRARETAEALAEGPVTLDPRLVEMDMGDWEGRIGAELLADPACPYCAVDSWGWDFRPPNGESPAEIVARLRPLLAELSAPCLLVTHRGVMRAVLALATGWNYDRPEPFRIKRAAVHPVRLEGGAPVAAAPPEKLAER
ncbi:MAG: histidine phosphatase family protein [Pseudomonadota bacterium]